LKVKVYRIHGIMRIKNSWQKFTLELTGLKERDVIEEVYSLLGSRHKLKRSHIKIIKIEEISPEDVEDIKIRKILSLDKLILFTRWNFDMSGTEESIRRLSAEYVLLRNLVQSLQERIELLNQLINNIEVTLNSLEGIKNLKEENEVLFPLGGIVYVKSKVLITNKVLINVGAGIVLEKNISEAMEYLRDRQRTLKLELQSALVQLRHATARLQEISAVLEKEAKRE